MIRWFRGARVGTGLLACAGLASCGGGGSDSLGSSSGSGTVTPADNVVSVAVTGGPQNTSINVLYTTITVCLPGTTTCQAIDNIQVDTGSYGLRILAPVLTLTFPVVTLSNGSLLECTTFVDGYSWGPVALADVQISGEAASSVPVQIIGDSRYPTVPTNCSNSAPNPEDTVASFGANGIIGIGPFAGDCGEFCVSSIPAPTALYYACTTESNCTATTVPLASQVPNIVTLFAKDNNGTIITLPSVAAAGATTVSGSLIFGIDTESNNASGTQTVVPISGSTGYISTIFGGATLADSFVDSGSNGYFFNDSSLSPCTQTGFASFYCPSSTTSLSAEMQLASGTAAVNFSVGDAEQIEAANNAYPGLAGTNPDPASFDWGLPFFFGRRIATAIEGYTTAAGTGPYVAY